MRRRQPNLRKLSVYLIKEGYRNFQSVIRSETEEYEVKSEEKIIGKLYIKQKPGHRPSWFSLFDGSVPEDLPEKLRNQNVSAALLLKRKGRIFVITFGFGRSLLKLGSWEERFGLKVVLNAIDPEKIRVIDRKTLDAMLTHTRTQTSRECAIGEFNLDVQQILLKGVTGEPKDAFFARHISGADALNITCQVTLDTLNNKCDELLAVFKTKDYQRSFPWVDNITEVALKQKVEQLNVELIKRIKSSNFDRLFLAVPDIIEWTEITGFQFREGDDEGLPDIHLPDFLNTLRDIEQLSVDFLKRRQVFQVRADTGISEPRWSIFHCLNCEVSDDGKTYILTEGKWYEVDESFVAQVNRRIQSVGKYNTLLAAGKKEKEDDYCQRVYKSNKSLYALMDRRMIRHGGGYSQMEFCDLYTKDKKLIHLKRYAGSSVLSHLFSQGTNCARVFLSDVEFRRKVNQKLPPSHQFGAETPPNPKDYEIVFGIISETADALPIELPFFSKITLMRSMQDLQNVMGFKVSLAGVRVE